MQSEKIGGLYMGKFEIVHYNDEKERIQYNTYHNCKDIKDAVEKHEQKGFKRNNIKSVTHHIKKKYSGIELFNIIKEES